MDKELEPSSAALAAIEAEWPVIEAELAVVEAECRLAVSSDELAVRAHRDAVTGLARVVRQVAAMERVRAGDAVRRRPVVVFLSSSPQRGEVA